MRRRGEDDAGSCLQTSPPAVGPQGRGEAEDACGKRVRYSKTCSLILIPTRTEYFDARIDLWYAGESFEQAKIQASMEIKAVMQANPELTFEGAVQLLYQPSDTPSASANISHNSPQTPFDCLSDSRPRRVRRGADAMEEEHEAGPYLLSLSGEFSPMHSVSASSSSSSSSSSSASLGSGCTDHSRTQRESPVAAGDDMSGGSRCPSGNSSGSDEEDGEEEMQFKPDKECGSARGSDDDQDDATTAESDALSHKSCSTSSVASQDCDRGDVLTMSVESDKSSTYSAYGSAHGDGDWRIVC